MIVALLAFFLTSAQQSKHDADERAMYQKIQAYQRTIDDIWRPKPSVLSAQRAARRCYTDFHLYRVDNCDQELATVYHELKLDLVSQEKQ